MQIAVLNQSKKVTDAQAMLMTQACAQQLLFHIAPAWNRIAVTVGFYTDPKLVPSDASPILILDAPDDPGALGYHTEDKDVVYGRIFVNPVLESGGTILYDAANSQNVSVASVLSHEIAELFLDPYVNLWADGPLLPDGDEYSFESADPVESDSYEIDVPSSDGITKVSVSNFIMPSWFDNQNTTGPFDYLNKLSAPFTMTPGGYIVGATLLEAAVWRVLGSTKRTRDIKAGLW